MLELRRLLRQQLLEALRATLRYPSRRGCHGGGPVDAARRTNDLAARQGPLVPPDSCFAEGRILVRSPRQCPSHGWTARVRVEHGGLPAPPEVTTYCPVHGWTSYFHDKGGPLAAVPYAYGIASPHRSPSSTYSLIRSSLPSYSPETRPYTPTPAGESYGRVTPLGLPSFEPRGTMAAHRGVLPVLQLRNELQRSGTGGLLRAGTGPSTTTSGSHSRASQRHGSGQPPPGPPSDHPDWAQPDRGDPARPLSLR
jgi:hypothetical protein